MANKGSTRAWLSGVAAVLMNICSLAPFSMFSLYIAQLAAETSSSVGQAALALSISTVGSVVASLLIGRLLKVVNPRFMIIFGGICVFAFQFTISLATSIIPIYIAAFFNGFGLIWGGIAMSQIIITQWFVKGRGMMLSVSIIAISLSLVIAIPIVAQIIAAMGYRSVLLVVGIIAGAGIIISSFLASGAPQKYGLQPLGAAEAAAGDDPAAQAASMPSLSWGKVIKSPVFWAIFAVYLLVNIVAVGFNGQAIVIFGSFGLDPTSAAFAFSLCSLIGMPLQFIFGFLCDKIGPKLGFAIYGALSAVALLVAFLLFGWVAAIIVALGTTLANTTAGLYGPNIAPRIFGAKDAGDIIGFLVMGSNAGGFIGPLLYGFMYDAFSDYNATLIVMGCIMAVCLVINFWLNSKGNINKINEQIADETAAAAAQAPEAADQSA